MEKHILTLLILGSGLAANCQVNEYTQLPDDETWRLGWRMIANILDENNEAAELQFDSLLNQTHLAPKFLAKGLEVKTKLGKKDAVYQILNIQDEGTLRQICSSPYLSDMPQCIAFSEEKVENKALQLELVRMYVDDQASRGNIPWDIVAKYDLDTTQISPNGSIYVDKQNRTRLDEIIAAHGLPTLKLVGKDAMLGAFFTVQHADGDKEWQKSQLKNIEMAVQLGDLDGQHYAYLYDRIKVNNGEPQLYGTQFAKVDPVNKLVELAETEDPANLDKRRKEMGMMPIEMYKRFMLKNL